MKRSICIAIIFILVFIAYSNTLLAPFHWDDNHYVTDNPSAKDLSELLKNINGSRVFAVLTFFLNFKIAGLQVWIYHITNILIHISASIIVFLLLELLLNISFKDIYLKYQRWIALFGALIFGLHPVNTEAVTYISQRFASLAAMLYLLSVFMYVKARFISQFPTEGKKATIYYSISIISAILAMKTKEISFTLPFAIFLFEHLFFSGKSKRPWPVLIIFTLSLLIIPLSNIDALWGVEEQSFKRKTAETFVIPRWQYFLTQMKVILTYLRLLIFPVNQNIDYDYPLSNGLFETDTFLSLLVHVCLMFTAIFLIRRDSGSRLLGAGILWFYITLSVESSIIPIENVICEYRVYLPLFGFALSISVLSMKSLPLGRYYKELAAAGAVILIIYGILAFQRNYLWTDSALLWGDAVKKSPNKIRTWLNYASYIKPEASIKIYEWVLSKDPWNLDAINGLSGAYIELGMVDKAEDILKRQGGVALTEKYMSNIVDVLISKREYERAIGYINKLIEKEHGNYTHYFRLGVIMEGINNKEGAVEAYRKALNLNPNDADVLNNLGNLVAEKGDLRESLLLLKKAAKLQPDKPSILMNLGITQAQIGDYDNAIWNFNKAIELDPRLPDAWFNKAIILWSAGLKDEAMISMKKALEVDPDYTKAKEILKKWQGG